MNVKLTELFYYIVCFEFVSVENNEKENVTIFNV